MSYQIKLEIFEGPMDLLLHLIKKHELDMYHYRTHYPAYLEYINLMKSLDMEIAGDFLVMASTLTHIKSKMLLPPPENPENDEDGIDPRAELIRRLLEYKSFKDAAGSLESKEELWRRCTQDRQRLHPICLRTMNRCFLIFISSTCSRRSRT